MTTVLRVHSPRKNKPFNPWMYEALITSRKRKGKLFNKKLRKPCHEKNTLMINSKNILEIVN